MNPRKIPKILIVASIAIMGWNEHNGNRTVMSKHNIGRMKK